MVTGEGALLPILQTPEDSSLIKFVIPVPEILPDGEMSSMYPETWKFLLFQPEKYNSSALANENFCGTSLGDLGVIVRVAS